MTENPILVTEEAIRAFERWMGLAGIAKVWIKERIWRIEPDQKGVS